MDRKILNMAWLSSKRLIKMQYKPVYSLLQKQETEKMESRPLNKEWAQNFTTAPPPKQKNYRHLSSLLHSNAT